MTASFVHKPLLRVLAGEREPVPPVWLMRQAGRYLPEYRALREKAAGFLDLCFDAKRAAEITLQPIRRFGFDAAILFSDILVVPHALGQRVSFVEGEGPRLDALKDPAALQTLRAAVDHAVLEPVYETIARVRQDLPPAVTFLGFCGAPWTLATYMIAGQGTPDQLPARLFAYRHAEAFAKLIELLVDASASYLVRQFAAGVDAVQLFDTWAGILPAREFERWCIEPHARIVEKVRAEIPGARIIGFPRGAGTELGRYLDAVAVDAVGLDWTIELEFARSMVQKRRPVQGNLDPLALLAGGTALDRSIDAILVFFLSGPIYFQSRPWRVAGNAGKPRRAARRTRAPRAGVQLTRDPEKWDPVFGKDHAQRKLAADRQRGGMSVDVYGWIKAFHIIAVIAWMAGMLYLPRLFVYHCAAEKGSVQSETFKVMERRLLRLIINPAMIATWILGLWLAWHGPDSHYGWFVSGWLQAKLAVVILLSAVHGLFARWVKAFAADRNQHSPKFYRIINEVPTIAMIIIVLLVVLKPF